MLYSEFIAGTGCKQNDHNFKVYQNLEAMYMHTSMTKEEIYEYGKKLVDNSKTEEQIKLEEKVNAEIWFNENEIKRYKGYIEENEGFLKIWKEDGDKSMIDFYRNSIRFYKKQVKELRMKVNELKWVLE